MGRRSQRPPGATAISIDKMGRLTTPQLILAYTVVLAAGSLIGIWLADIMERYTIL
jgi:hypothetical protein